MVKRIRFKNKEEQAVAEPQKTTDDSTVRIVLNPSQFSHVCKVGFITTQEKTGRADINFTSGDIISLCKDQIIEKHGIETKYEFKLAAMDQYERREIVKRSPFFGSLHEQV